MSIYIQKYENTRMCPMVIGDLRTHVLTYAYYANAQLDCDVQIH